MVAPKGHDPYPGCETGGRPKVYTDEFLESEAEALLEWMTHPDNLYFKSFAIERGYHPQRLGEFAAQNQKFSEVYSIAQAWQEQRLVNGALKNQLNGGFTKFVLGNTAGWTDRTQVSGDGSNPLAFVLNQVDGSTKDLVDE